MGFGGGRGSRCPFTCYLPQQEDRRKKEGKKEERKQVERKERNGGRKEERKNERRMNQSNVIFLHKTQEQTCTYWGEIKEDENSR